MDIIYKINQSNESDSIANAKNIPRSLNLDTDNNIIRVVPAGQETTSGYEIPSTQSSLYGKVFVGSVNGKRIYKELKDCIVTGDGTKVTPVTLQDGTTGVKVSTNLTGSDGIVVRPNGDSVDIGFAQTNRDGVTGFSLTRFAGEDWNLYNPTLVSPSNPDWVKNVPTSQILIEETTATKTYEFVAPKDGIWNVGFSFNDVWNSIRPITGLSTYTASDFGRDFEVRVDVIKNNVSVIGVQQQYRLMVDANVTKYQDIVDGEDSTFIVDRVSNLGSSSIYLYGLYLDENYEIIDASSYAQYASASDGSPYFKRVLVEFSDGVTEVRGSSTIVSHVAEAKYIVWSFSKSEIITKTLTPSGDAGVIPIAHQSVRASENGTVVDNTFNRNYWLMLETGDTVRARCIFGTGDLAPVCEASFSALYMLPGITIGQTPVEPTELYDYVVTEYQDWQLAMEDEDVVTVFVTDDFTVPSTIINYAGDKRIYGQNLNIDSSIIIGSQSDKSVDIYNNVLLTSGSTQTVTCKNVRMRRIVSKTDSEKSLIVPKGFYGVYEIIKTLLGSVTGGTQEYWDNTSDINLASITSTLGKYVTQTSLGDTLDGYVTDGELTTALGSYITQTSLGDTLDGYVTDGELTTALSGYTNNTGLAEGYVTTSNVPQIVLGYKNIYYLGVRNFSRDHEILMINDDSLTVTYELSNLSYSLFVVNYTGSSSNPINVKFTPSLTSAPRNGSEFTVLSNCTNDVYINVRRKDGGGGGSGYYGLRIIGCGSISFVYYDGQFTWI